MQTPAYFKNSVTINQPYVDIEKNCFTLQA